MRDPLGSRPWLHRRIRQRAVYPWPELIRRGPTPGGSGHAPPLQVLKTVDEDRLLVPNTAEILHPMGVGEDLMTLIP